MVKPADPRYITLQDLIESGVGFASAAPQHADEIHLFNFDAGTVWWDDLTMAFSDSRFRAAEPALPFVP